MLRLEMARLKYGEIVWRDLRCSSNTAGTVVIYFGNSIMLDTPKWMTSDRILDASSRWELRARHGLWSAVRAPPSSCVCTSLDSLGFD